VNCSKGDRLRPPSGIGAIAEKSVHQCVAKFAQARQVLAKFSDRLCPIICPQTGPVVDCSFCGATDFLETQGRQSRRQSTTDLIIDSSLTRLCKPTTPERTHVWRFGDRDRKEIRFNQEDGTSRPQARNEIRDRLFGVSNMVKHCTSRDNVKTPRHHWPGHDISLAQLQIRQAHVDERKIEIDGYCSSIRSDLPGKPRGN
jgi:hypothetical protein